MNNINQKMGLALLAAITLLTVVSGKRTSTKTKLDIRVVRSPQQHHDATAAYVLSSQHARSEDGHGHEEQEQHHHQVSLVSESQYEALLKQAQKALQGYDLSKLSAAVAHHQAAPTAVEYQAPKVVYKPEVKYVHKEQPTSVAYNTAPAAYGSYTHDHSHDDHEQHQYSKHKFGYRVHDPHTGAAFGHSEVSEGHVTKGHYHVLLPDGRLQNVKYVADPSGYHATVTYESYKHY